MGIIAAGQITVVDLSDAPVLNTFITASRPTTQTYSKDSHTYKPSYASTPQVLTLKLTKAGSTANIIDSISSLHWFVVDGPVKTEITSKDNAANEYISGTHNEILTTKLDIDLNKGSKRYEVMGIWPDPSTGLDVQFGGYIDLLLTQNGATGPQGPQGDTGNGIANTVITYGLSMSDTTEPATWSSEMPTLVKGMYLWTRTVIIYTNGSSTTSYQISYIAKDADATAEIDKAKQELLEKLETVRDESLEAVDEAKQQLVTVRDESLAAAEEAKQGLANVASELNTAKQELADSVTAVNNKVDSAKAELTQAKQDLATVADDLSTAKQDFQNAVSAVDTKATNLQSDLTQAKQDLASQAQQLQEQASAQSELTNRVSSVEETANGTKTTVSELSKTVAQNGKDITSVTARTKVVEDDLAGTKTTLSQVQTTANSTSQKTATLETGLNGLSAKFENLSVGATNHFLDSAFETTIQKIGILQNGNVYTPSIDTTEKCDGYNTLKIVCEDSAGVDNPKITYRALAKLKTVQQGKLPDVVTISFWGKTDTKGMGLYTRLGYMGYVDSQNVTLTTDWKRYIVHVKTSSVASNEWTFKLSKAGTVWIAKPQFEFSAIASDYHSAEEDTSSKVAEYKQNADQNYASLQTTVQNLDGTVQHNKTVAEQTAEGFKTRIESLETYKSGESTRANQYFESAKTETARQLSVERTAIAKDYVAKSTYTSDVTGIRNELSATTATANTTKTNLANYQATNDRAVANLQSNIQTANGDISSLKTKVEAVPGQITSAVSSVESKIPKSVGGRNLALGTSADWSAGLTSFNGQNNQTRTIYHIYNRGFKIGDKINIRLVLKYSDIAATEGQRARAVSQCCGNVTGWGSGQLDAGGAFYFDGSDGEIEFKGTTVVNENIIKNEYWDWNLRVDYVTNGKIQWKEAKAEVGDLPTPWSPAPEDTAEQISNLSSEIKQTADGMTLLATKTELSTAKTELQSGINTATNKANNAQTTANNNAQTISTHTTQISALNTGLQAKVSQTEFNTLSGRVTTAENNITAKANELSSKITSVEGKIPTSVGTVNLVKDTGSGFVMGYGITNTTWNETKKQAILDFSIPGVNLANSSEILPQGNKFCDFKPIKGTTYTQSIMIDTDATFNPNGQANCTWFANGQHNQQKAYIKKVGAYSYQVWSTYTWNLENTALRAFDWFGLHNVLGFRNSGTYLAFYKPKLTSGNLPSDWSPAPEDTATQISSLSSELKQTKDGITLLATKTELNNAKNELQSGINTATNKANTNAQTISTHTTQISALNTGLQAKVSQTDFNTLSGRVTTAENNITAKANELSSKITSVEGKIPTSVGVRNLLSKTNQGKTYWGWAVSSGGTTAEDYNVDGVNAVKLTRTSDSSVTWDYIRYDGLLRKLIKPNTKYTLSFDVKPSVDVTFTASLRRGDSGASLTNSATMNKATANKWTKVSCILTSTSTLSDDLSQVVYLQGMSTAKDNYLIIKNIKLEEGVVSSDWQPAPEDAINQINSLSSELKQTADGITLLATKTELNNAKNELQSGINTAQNKANSNAQTISTHTTQISALNTGLQAKVSQTEFNTLSGRVTNAENNITAKANELSSKITSVEGKIPTEIGSSNLLRKTAVNTENLKLFSKAYTTVSVVKKDGHQVYKLVVSGSNNAGAYFGGNGDYYNLVKDRSYTFSFWVLTNKDKNYNMNSLGHIQAVNTNGGSVGNDPAHQHTQPVYSTNIIKANTWTKVWCTFKVTSNSYFIPYFWYLKAGDEIYIYDMMLNEGKVPLSYTPAPEDTISQISSLSSELSQTKDGITLLATKTELNTAKNELQSGINTATNKANSAQNTANNAQSTANSAQNKANSNAQTISTHTTQISALNTGLQAKVSQSDFNTLSGRVTNAENNITAKANELSSKITSVEGKIPTEMGSANLLRKTAVNTENLKLFGKSNSTISVVTKDGHQTYKIVVSANGSGVYFDGNSQYYNLIKDRPYTFSFWVLTNKDKNYNMNSLGHIQAVNENSDKVGNDQYHQHTQPIYNTNIIRANTWTKVWCTFKATSNSFFRPYFWYLNSGDEIYIYDMMLNEGKVPLSYTPAPEDTINQINSVSSEFKQTTDSIKASVSSLDKSTVKSSSLTINSDGIVMKAGKSTTDVANAIGSYFAVNQNAIDLFADKIKVKGNMIVSGSISSDKIASNGITANVIKGGTLQSTNGSTNFELNTGKLFYNNNNTGVFRVQNGASTMGLKFSNTSISVGGTNRILSRAILGGDRRESTLDDGKWDKGGFSGLVIETIKGVEPATNEHADALRAISDTIYFTHTYSADSPTGVSAHGWKMETYAPNSSYSGNIVLKPYGINYRQSDIIVGDVRLDNGDGSGYWMRATINTLKACFGHILNGGTSSQALNAIRSELNKISGT